MKSQKQKIKLEKELNETAGKITEQQMRLRKIISNKKPCVTLKAQDISKLECAIQGETLVRIKTGGKDGHTGPLKIFVETIPRPGQDSDLLCCIDNHKNVCEADCTWLFHNSRMNKMNLIPKKIFEINDLSEVERRK
jgi:hypothetical protein